MCVLPLALLAARGSAPVATPERGVAARGAVATSLRGALASRRLQLLLLIYGSCHRAIVALLVMSVAAFALTLLLLRRDASQSIRPSGGP